MCGRYTAAITPEQLRLRWEITEFRETRIQPPLPRWNVAPTQILPVVVERPGRRIAAAMTWGFAPAWMGPGRAPPPINARAETVATNGLFKKSLSRYRCIVPATGFYEWQAITGEKRKAPHHIRLADAEVFGFAGIYTPPQSSEDFGTYAIITTTANERLAPIHDRMPVILPPGFETLWLDPSVTDPERVLPLLQPFPPERMAAYRVGYAVGTPANDGPELVAPLA
jgi:putative SOS response-associated peptidase YedK